MTEIEAAWLGAIMEGEGTVCRNIFPRQATRTNVFVTNTDVEILSACLRITGVGSIYPHNPPTAYGRKACWRWVITAKNDVAEILRRIAPYCMKAQRSLYG